jgi:predicted enzyme related to lactoylglutathione lyase
MPYWQIDIGGAGEGGIMPMPDMVPPEVPAYWLDYFGTADIAASIAKAKELGATVTVEPAAVGGMVSFAVLEDPAGATFALMQPLGSM